VPRVIGLEGLAIYYSIRISIMHFPGSIWYLKLEPRSAFGPDTVSGMRAKTHGAVSVISRLRDSLKPSLCNIEHIDINRPAAPLKEQAN
jgi:hypothetical protein